MRFSTEPRQSPKSAILSSTRPDALVWIARPGVGKTLVLGHTARAAADADLGHVFFSLEMPTAQIVERIARAHYGLGRQHFRDRFMNGAVDQDDYPRTFCHFVIVDAPGLSVAQMTARLRQLQAAALKGVPILDRIWQWATVQVGLPRSDFGKAVRYMLERWEGLTRFVDDPRIPLDNNAAERARRGPVVGRKNHSGSRSLRGTQLAALFYTLCETARLVGVDPHAYLLSAVYAAIAEPATVTFPDAVDLSPQLGAVLLDWRRTQRAR